MSQRRIDPTEGDHALKAIAGQLQKLSYRDMQRFVKAVNPNATAAENVELIEMLLTGAETILKEPNGH